MALLSNYLKTTFTATTPSPLSSGNYIIGDNFNGALPVTWSVDATPTNAVSTIVARDASGNFTAGKATLNLDVYDTRSTQTGPNTGSKQARFDFKSNSTDGLADGGSYHGVLTIQQWNDPTGGGTRQLGFTDNDNLWIRGSGTGLTAYNPWKLVLNSANFSTYALPLTGGVLSGDLTANAITAQTGVNVATGQSYKINNAAVLYLGSSGYGGNVGFNNTNTSTGTTVGSNNTSSSAIATAIGDACQATGFLSNAVGYSCVAEGTNACAIGYTNTSSGTSSVALGYGCTTLAGISYGVAMGYGCDANAGNAIAIGKDVTNTTAGSLEIGPNNTYKIAISNVGVTTFTGTAAVTVPNGTDAQRPTGQLGMIRYSTTSNAFEGYSSTGWGSIGTSSAASMDAAVAMAIALG